MRCDACEEIFCKDHITYANHKCTSSYKKVCASRDSPLNPILYVAVWSPPGNVDKVDDESVSSFATGCPSPRVPAVQHPYPHQERRDARHQSRGAHRPGLQVRPSPEKEKGRTLWSHTHRVITMITAHSQKKNSPVSFFVFVCPCSQIFTNKCSKGGCKQKEMIRVTCDQCHSNYCLKHRHPLDHDCKTEAQPVSKSGWAQPPPHQHERQLRWTSDLSRLRHHFCAVRNSIGRRHK